MAIEIVADFRRLARAGVWSLAGILTLSAAAGAQATCGISGTPPCVSVGSLVPIPYTTKMNQIYRILFYKGNVLALDAGDSILYQLPPGSSVWNQISGSTGFLGVEGSFNPSGMAMDAQGTLYISDNIPQADAPTALFWRFPYDAAKNSWDLSSAGAWGGNIIDPYNPPNTIVSESGQGSVDVQFENSPAMDGSGTLYFVSSLNQIYTVQVDNQANADKTTVTATGIINALNGGGSHMAIDAAGNIYFVEGHAISCTGTPPAPCLRPPGTTGLWFIPANTSVPGVLAGGAAEQYLQNQGWRIDNLQETSSSPIIYAGVTLDAAGNLYLSSETNSSYAETFSGLWELPNVCGPAAVTGANLNTCMDDGAIELLAGIPGNQSVAIDSRGYIWLTPYQTYGPGGEGTQVGVYALGVFAPGVLNLNAYTPGAGLAGPTPTGTTGLPGNLYVAFNGPFTPSAFQFSNATGTASQFGTTQTNPIPVPNATTPTVPCNSTTGNVNGAFTTFSDLNACLLWVTMDPTVPGNASAELTIYGSTPTKIGTSTIPISVNVYVSGTGQGGAVAMLDSPQLNTLAAPTALSQPGQVATDALGDTWVADSGEKQVLYFPAGSSSATGKSIDNQLSDPTGVAVDGVGDIYIADYNSSKKLGTVYEIPWVPSNTNAGGAYGNPTTLSTKAMGLGNNLNLAVDGTGDVYVADPSNARVVKIPSPAQAFLVVNPETISDATTTATVTAGSGFTAPSAVAVDNSGNVFVADGTSLYEVAVFPSNLQTTITSSLPGTVTGLTVDASGAVIAAISGQGLYRIPNIITAGVGALSVNSASLIDTSFTLPGSANPSSPGYCGGPGACTTTTNVTSPGGVALDQEGNIYLSDMTLGVPNLYEMNVVKGVVNYGAGLTPQIKDEQDLDLFNIGNEPMNLTPNPPSFIGPDAADYSLTAPSAGTPCDTSGVKAVAAGSSCSLGPTFDPPSLTDLVPHIYSDSLSIPTNASNINGSGTATATLQAASINNLETTQTIVVPNITSMIYPGSATVTVNISLSPSSAYQYPPPPVGTGIGTVQLTLSCTSAGCTQASIVETGTVSVTSIGPGDNFSASATFNNLPALDGGGYQVTADYEGSVLNLMGKSTNVQTFTINKATPVITLSQPLGVTPNATNGVYYLLQGAPNTLVANVSSKVGSPSGTVALWNSPVVTSGVCTAGATGTDEGTGTYTSAQNWTFSTGSMAGSLNAPAYSIIACYGGDENYSAIATTVPVTFQVITSGVLLTASPAALTTTAGTPVATTITIQSLVGFSAPTGANIICNISQLGVPNFPYDSECTFSNPQPQICAPSAGTNCTPVTTVLTLSTNIPVNVQPNTASNTHRPQSFRSPLELAGIFGLGLLGLALRRRAIFNRYLLNLVCLGLFFAGTVMGITSCTNDGYTHTPVVPVVTTPAGNYKISIQVTNTATGVVESLPFTLPVTINAQ